MAKKRSGFYLPEELIFQILSWLPVISILRFKLVCKSWRSMISSPKLIENHLANSHKKEAYVLRFGSVQINKAGGIGHAFYLDTRDISVALQPPPHSSLVKPFVHSCNGLVCISDGCCWFISLWNPLTKRFKKLPIPEIKINFNIRLGLCFDSISKDYKLLRIAVFYDLNDGYVFKAELYSTNANSWKKIQVPKTVENILPCQLSGFVETGTGVLYIESPNKLLSFDSHYEVFGVYPFLNNAKYKVMSNVLNFDGSVAMIFESIFDKSVLSLWTLDDICGDVNWVKKFNLEADYGISWISLYLGAGQFVAECNYGTGYCFYDYKRNKTKQLPSPRPLSDHPQDAISVIKYSESLVSLEGFKQLD